MSRFDGIDRKTAFYVVLFIAVGGVAMALLVYAIHNAREAARRSKSLCNMKGISIALQNYYDTHGHFPATGDATKSQLSWRVHILPYLEDADLHKEFHLDEPWDSEHNKALISRMPNEFRCPQLELAPGNTVYLAVVGQGTAFGNGHDGPTRKEFTDGTSKTAIVVEADPNEAVEWTKPDDWQFDPTDPTRSLGHVYPQGFVAAFADSHTSVLSTSNKTAVAAIMTAAGNENNEDYDHNAW